MFPSRFFVSVILFLCKKVYTVRGDCGAIPVFEHSQSNLTAAPPYPQETVAEISCDTGYARSGYRIIKCQADGTWLQHSSPPTCTPKTCGDPGTPENGRKDTYLYTVGSTVRFSCDEGYEIQGNSNRICKVTAEWTGSTPTCVVVTCPALPNPANGALKLEDTDLNYQSTVSLVCNEGFRSEGPTARVCQGDKTWSNQEFVCQEIDCGPFGSIPNAEVEPQGGTTWGESVQVRCFYNATSSNGQSNRIIHCNDEGVWAPEPQQCLARCTIPQNYNGTIREADSKMTVKAPTVPHNTQLIFTCPENFVLRPDMSSSVQGSCENGTLTVTPSCVEAPCQVAPGFSSNNLDPSCLLEGGKYIKHGCSFLTKCSEGNTVNGTCVYGEIKSSCTAPQNGGFPPWGWAIIVVVAIVIGLVIFFVYKKVSKSKIRHKPVPDHDSQAVQLNDNTSEKVGNGEPV